MAKDTCEGELRLEMRWLKKKHYLDGLRSAAVTWTSNHGREDSVRITVDTASKNPRIQFFYVQTNRDGEKTTHDYGAELSPRSCRFGGRRFYFICPLTKNGVPCRRRALILYLSGRWFGCRKCHDLAYESQQERHGGMLGTYAKYWSRSDRSETKRERMRVKFWKGKPTRRYQRLLDHDERFGDFDPEQTERKLMALLGRNF